MDFAAGVAATLSVSAATTVAALVREVPVRDQVLNFRDSRQTPQTSAKLLKPFHVAGATATITTSSLSVWHIRQVFIV
jgi:hypothetical protein